MYQKPWTQIVAENPDSEFSKFLVRFFSAKPDFTELDKEIEKETELLYQQQMAELQRRLSERKTQQAVMQ